MGSKNIQSLLEIWNSPSWKDLRRKMMQNERSEACQICWKKEDQGLLSGRQKDVDRSEFFALIKPDGEISSQPKSISIRLGNKCNLACIMCSPMNSSLWRREKNIYEKHVGIVKSFEVEDLDLQEDQFQMILEDAEVITFIGGEPLLFRQHQQIVQFLLENKKANQIELHYYSNMTTIPDWCLEAWPKFRKINLRSSIDATGAIYEYIRFPAKWDSILAQLEKLKNADLGNLEHSFCFLLMNLSVFELEKFVVWRNSFYENRSLPLIKPDYLVEPVFLQGMSIPDHMKHEALMSLERAKKIAQTREVQLIQDMSKLVAQKSEDAEFQMLRLKKYLSDLDLSRGSRYDHHWLWMKDV